MITVDKKGNIQEPLIPSSIERVVDEKGNTFGMVVNDEFIESEWQKKSSRWSWMESFR